MFIKREKKIWYDGIKSFIFYIFQIFLYIFIFVLFAMNYSTKREKILYFCSFIIFFITCIHLIWLFYSDNSSSEAVAGGKYVEGSVGNIRLINPLLAQPNTPEDDITKLVYSGLTKYDPKTQNIVSDLAVYTVDNSKRKYTFKLKENAKWHDGKNVTADDIMFTYQGILQNPEFGDEILKSSFYNVVIEKIDESTVNFTLPAPYYFFPYATTIGVLPKHLWEIVPVRNLDKSELNLMPIGSGPYKVAKIHTAVRDQPQIIDLEVFKNFYGEKPLIASLSFKAFESSDKVIQNLQSLDAVNNVSNQSLTTFTENDRFQVFSYTLPQYVGVFFNGDKDILKDKKVRLALSLATNKEKLLKEYPAFKRVDTPFVENKNQAWRYEYDATRANGSLFDAGWKKKPVTSTSSFQFAATETPNSNYKITEPNNGENITSNVAYFVIRGTAPTNAQGVEVNGYRLQRFTASKGSWSYVADANIGTLKPGKNTYNVSYVNEQGTKVFLDSITITYDTSVKGTIVAAPIPGNVNKNANTDPKPTNTNINQATLANNTNVNTQQISSQNVNAPVQNSNNSNIVLAQENTNNSNLNAQNQNTNVNSGITSPIGSSNIPESIKNQLRYNDKGDPLVLNLITSSSPTHLEKIAQFLQQEWLTFGIYINIEILPPDQLFTRIQAKSYDILLYGQNIKNTLDMFPFWHSSQSGEKGLNLSNFKNFQADTLMEQIRNPSWNNAIDVNNPEQVEKEQLKDIESLQKIFEEEFPAIFLYQPFYHYSIDTKKVKNMEIANLTFFSDRFSFLEKSFIQEKKVLSQPFSFTWFYDWVLQNF